MTEPEADVASVHAAPSDAGSIADSDDSDFEVEGSTLESSDSSSDDDEASLASQDVQDVHLEAGELLSLRPPRHTTCAAASTAIEMLAGTTHCTLLLQEAMETRDCRRMRRRWMMLTWSHQMRR